MIAIIAFDCSCLRGWALVCSREQLVQHELSENRSVSHPTWPSARMRVPVVLDIVLTMPQSSIPQANRSPGGRRLG